MSFGFVQVQTLRSPCDVGMALEGAQGALEALGQDGITARMRCCRDWLGAPPFRTKRIRGVFAVYRGREEYYVNERMLRRHSYGITVTRGL